MNKFSIWLRNEGATDAVVANKIGVSEMYILKLRTGKLKPTPSFSWKFALAYGFGLARELFDTEKELAS